MTDTRGPAEIDPLLSSTLIWALYSYSLLETRLSVSQLVSNLSEMVFVFFFYVLKGFSPFKMVF